MIDMTNNRVPYGLLTDEERGALHDHEKAGGEFELNYCLHWSPISKPTWYSQTIYRTVPLPAQRSEQSSLKTQDVIAWDRLPERIQWVIRFEDEEVWAYEYEPHVELGWWSFDEGDAIRIDDFPGIVQIGTVDWKDSKQRRPRG
jgi:hypothetical protein